MRPNPFYHRTSLSVKAVIRSRGLSPYPALWRAPEDLELISNSRLPTSSAPSVASGWRRRGARFATHYAPGLSLIRPDHNSVKMRKIWPSDPEKTMKRT
jgi:hypothetical protein